MEDAFSSVMFAFGFVRFVSYMARRLEKRMGMGSEELMHKTHRYHHRKRGY